MSPARNFSVAVGFRYRHPADAKHTCPWLAMAVEPSIVVEICRLGTLRVFKEPFCILFFLHCVEWLTICAEEGGCGHGLLGLCLLSVFGILFILALQKKVIPAVLFRILSRTSCGWKKVVHCWLDYKVFDLFLPSQEC